MARRGSSSRWLQRQQSDRFVKQRDQQGYRSRAAYKLAELATRDQLIRPADRVLDLGASPGGWTQVAVEMAGPRGRVTALDLLPIEPIPGAHCIIGDCRDAAIRAELAAHLAGQGLDLVMSDMAPNITGVAAVDEAGMLDLAHMTLDISRQFLRPGGSLLMKLFQFADTAAILDEVAALFALVARRKPAASRAQSREFYVVAKRYGI